MRDGPFVVKNRSVSHDVVVVGGGVAGAAAACAFASRGARVVVYERRLLERDPNRGDALHSSAVKTIRGWGALPFLRKRGAVRFDGALMTSPHGRARVAFRLGRQSLLALQHPEIELGLQDAAVSLGATLCAQAVKSVRRERDGWAVSTDGGTTNATLLVGADGMRSLIRERLGIPLVREKQYRETALIVHGPKPAWLEPNHAWVATDRHGLLLAVPSPPGGYRYAIAIRPEEEREWLSLDDARFRERVTRRSRLLAGIELTRRGGHHVYRLRRQEAASFIGDHAAIIGDAAHVTHPALGEGMLLAIHDADALAARVVPVLLSDKAALNDALRAFDRKRRRQVRRKINRADWSSRFEVPGAAAGVVGFVSLALAGAAPPFMRNAVARWMFR